MKRLFERKPLTPSRTLQVSAMPPSLIKSVDQKQLQAIGPALVLNRFGQEQFVTSHAANGLDF